LKLIALAACALAAASIPVRADTLQTTVRDPSGLAVPGAYVRVFTTHGSLISHGVTGVDGVLSLELPRGSYRLRAEAEGFAARETAIAVPSDENSVSLELPVNPVTSAVTVTSSRGFAEERSDAAALIGAVSRDEVQQQAGPLSANALEGIPGVLLQQTTYGQISPFLRGLTGYQVLTLVDGIRFNNSTFRSGPNQYLAFGPAAQVQLIETMLGPASSQFGSDALGGTIQVLTPVPVFTSTAGRSWNGELHVSGATADLSSSVSAMIAAGTPRFSWLAGASGRKHNDLRAGGGTDSRNVFRKMFGLDDGTIAGLSGSRLQDTGFGQIGWEGKAAFRPAQLDTFTVSYQGSDLSNVRTYNSLLGGLGRMQALAEPQRLNLLYARYERVGLGPLDTVSGTFSLNSQRDASERQGLRSIDTVTFDDTRVDAYGYAAQASAQLGAGHAIVFGGEFFDERINSKREELNPVTSILTVRRPLYPDDSRYRTTGLFVQDSFELFRGRLRLQGGARWTGISYRTNEDIALGVAASRQTFSDGTFNSSAIFRVTSAIAIHGLIGRGFRAPNANDLGAVGLNDLGYEVPSSDAVAAGAVLSTSAGEDAVPTGKPLENLSPERLWNFEAGIRIRSRNIYARVQVFNAELLNPIVRRTLLFPAGQLPATVGSLPVSPAAQTEAQRAAGVRGVASAFDPRTLKTFVNDGHSRYYGGEGLIEYHLTFHWSARGSYSILAGRDLNPNRPVRRLPPQMGSAALRYSPARRWWMEIRTDFAGRQDRLSGGDRDDERIGASRSRRDIADFFGGSRVAPFLDGNRVFLPTGESLSQIQARVLPGVTSDTTRVPLYTSTAGWADFQIRGAYMIAERTTLFAGVYNLLDKSYRIHGSGTDAPGASAVLTLTYRF
jgi:hemoglobin/transferrin/lactoferrin receptor protein